jgi:hypothetical protein
MMLKKKNCYTIFLILSNINICSVIESTNIKDDFDLNIDPYTVLTTTIAFGTSLLTNSLIFSQRERFMEIFFNNDMQKLLACGVIITVSSFLDLSWKQWVTNILSLGVGVLFGEFVKSENGSGSSFLSLFLATSACAIMHAIVKHLLEEYENNMNKKSKKFQKRMEVQPISFYQASNGYDFVRKKNPPNEQN